MPLNMLSPDKKNLATMIVEGPKVEKVSDNETDYSAGMEAAGQDIAQAIEKKDVKLLVAGLKDLFAMLIDEHESNPVEDDEEESKDEDESTPPWKK
jgi:hypothetical protein